ncbi:MAG: glycoside hydrolase family 3 protein, partial [Myxococcota bacterium]
MAAPTKDPNVEARIQSIIAKMTVEEKIGQIIQADIDSITPQQAKEFFIGAVLNGGNSAPGGDLRSAPSAWLELADKFWDASIDRSNGRSGIPIFWGTDAVHGHNN